MGLFGNSLSQKLTSVDWGFSFFYPKGWEVFWKDEPAGSWIIPYAVAGKFKEGGRVIFMTNAHKIELLEGNDYFTVFQSYTDGTHRQSPKTPNEYIETMKGSMASDFDKYEYLSSYVTEVCGIPAANISYTYDQSGNCVYEEMITIFAKGRTLQLICSMPNSKKREGIKMCNNIIKKFVIEK